MVIRDSQERAVVPVRDLSVWEMEEICRKQQESGLLKSGMGYQNRPPFSTGLDGQELQFIFTDRPAIWYRVLGNEQIAWSDDGTSYKEEDAQILELDSAPGVYFIHHLRSFTFPLKAFTLVYESQRGLVTLVASSVGDSRHWQRDVNRQFHFGYCASLHAKQPAQLHGFTEDLVGKCIEWNYVDTIVKHLYNNNIFMTYMVLTPDKPYTGFCLSAIADYVKVNEKIYIFSWIETGGPGVTGIVMMDTSIWHDVGCIFGINGAQILDSFTFAARGTYTDQMKPYHF